MSQSQDKTEAISSGSLIAELRAQYEAACRMNRAQLPRVEEYLSGCSEKDRAVLRAELEKVRAQFRSVADVPPATVELSTDTPQPAAGATVDFAPPDNRALAGPAATVQLNPSELESVQTDPKATIALQPESGASGGSPDATVGWGDSEEAWLGGSDPAGATRMDASGQTESASAAPRAFVPGYEILGELGRGGMGVVYKARQIKLDRIVALKMVLAGAHAGSEQLARFYTEAQAVAHLQHPNIVQIYEVSEQTGLPYFSLEYVDGGSLSQKTAGKPQPEREAAETVEALARAMHYAHQNGVVHRDLKPANVLLTAHGVPKITDFGLAKRLEGESSGQTRSGAILGTPSYMAPEQAMGEVREIGPLTDVYALGAILYELLTGRPPFAGPTPMDTVVQVTRDEPVAPSVLQPKVPADVETICLKCLEKERHKRYGSAAELADDLRRFLNGEPILARPISAPERLWRWCRRNPKIATLSAAVFLLLFTVAITSTVAAVKISHQRDEIAAARELADRNAAEEKIARQQADENARIAREQGDLAVGALYDVVTTIQTRLRGQPGEGLQELRQQVLNDAFEKLSRIVSSSETGQTYASRSRAAAFQHLGDIAFELGRSEEALDYYKQCLAIIEGMLNERPNDDATVYNLAAASEKMGTTLLQLEDFAVAQEYFRRALDARVKLTELEITDPRLSPEKVRESLGGSYLQQSSLALVLGRPEQAWEYLQHYFEATTGVKYNSLPEVLAMSREKRLEHNLILRLGELSFHLNDLETTRGFYDQAAARAKAGYERFANDAKNRRVAVAALTATHTALGDFTLYMGDASTAREHYNTAHPFILEYADDSARAQRIISMSHYRLGTANLKAGDGVKAIEHYQQCLELREKLAANDQRNLHKQIDLMVVLARCGRHREAAELAEKFRARATEDPSILFQVACGYALCLGAADQEGSESRDHWVDTYRTAALDAVRLAIKLGYRDAVALGHDPDLEPIRDHAEFQQMLRSVAAR